MPKPKNINPDAWKVLVLILKNIAAQKGISHQAIANITGYQKSHITRVFSLMFPPSFETFVAITTALNCYHTIEDKDDQADLAIALKQADDQLKIQDPSLN